MEFNIVATVGTTEVDLVPYPGGTSAEVPADRTRKVYAMVLTNTAAAANTLTLKLYRGATLEASVSITVPASSTLVLVSERPVLVVPGGRTLRATASAANIDLLMACCDE